MERLIQDLHYAARMLLRSPGFTVVAVITLALGIGGTTAVLSITNALFFRSLPVPRAERVVAVVEHREEGTPGAVFSYPDYAAYRDGSAEAFSELAAVANMMFGLRTETGAESVQGAFVSGNYFRMLDVQPALGRYLLPEEDASGVGAVAVLGHESWVRRFGGDPEIIGRTIHLNGHPLTVVGVARAGFRGTLMTATPELWVPIAAREFLAPERVEQEGRRIHWLWVQGRLADGVARAQAAAALSVAGRQLSADRAEGRRVRTVELRPAGGLPPAVEQTASTVTGVLLIASALVLLIASTNVAGMLLARAMKRRREIAIRLAIGAGAGRLVRQLLTESALLFVIGGAVGVLIAYRLTDLASSLLAVTGGPLPLDNLDPSPDASVLLAALLLSLLAGSLFGLAPALQATRTDLVPALREAAGSGRRSRLRSLLVIGQVAMCLLLLLGAGLFIRSLQQAARVELGFEPQGVLTGRLNLEPHGYDAERGLELYRQLGERIEALPGVRAVSYAFVPPLSGMVVATSFSVGGEEEAELTFNVVTPQYFATLGIPLLRGRLFDAEDRAGAAGAALVNESFVRRYFADDDAVGRTIQLLGDDVEIVGIVRDSKWGALDEEAFPFAYRPLAQEYDPSVALFVRTTGDPARLESAIRRELQALNPDLPLQAVTTLEAMVRQLSAPQRITAWGASGFGVVGLLLAVVGLYGVLAYAVAQRTREIGVRLALGATPGDVIRLVLRQGALLVGSGMALGLAASVWLVPLLGGLLFEVGPTDPLALAGVVLLLAVVALLASYLPARRAARVDPMIALRTE